jgi:hypothetical protein
MTDEVLITWDSVDNCFVFQVNTEHVKIEDILNPLFIHANGFIGKSRKNVKMSWVRLTNGRIFHVAVNHGAETVLAGEVHHKVLCITHNIECDCSGHYYRDHSYEVTIDGKEVDPETKIEFPEDLHSLASVSLAEGVLVKVEDITYALERDVHEVY